MANGRTKPKQKSPSRPARKKVKAELAPATAMLPQQFATQGLAGNNLSFHLDAVLPSGGPLPVDYSQAMRTGGAALFGTLKDDNCTFSAIGNIISCWFANANPTTPLPISYPDLIKAWAVVAHDVSQNPQAFWPIIPYLALYQWKNPGVGPGPDNILHFAQLVSQAQLCQAIAQFGAAFVSLNLPNYLLDAAKKGNLPLGSVWDAPPPGTSPADATANGSLGHSVAAVGFDGNGLIIVSWSNLYILSWRFLATYEDTFNSYAIVGKDWLNTTTGRSPSQIADLEGAFQAIFSGSPHYQ